MCCSARSTCCARWTSSRRADSVSSRATTTCWSTSFRIRAARNGNSFRLLIQSWGEGMGLATEPSIFVVGDRKQSIYRFRDAEVAVMQEAGRYIEGLRPAGSPRQSIRRSFRALPQLLEFVNDLFTEIAQPGARPDDFTYTESDTFPSMRNRIDAASSSESPPRRTPNNARPRSPNEIARIVQEETVRDRQSGVARAATPGDIAILFRSRTSHREFQQALEARGIPAYVYKGLGFFDADEIKDVSCADSLPCESRIRPPRRGLSPITVRSALRRGRLAARARTRGLDRRRRTLPRPFETSGRRRSAGAGSRCARVFTSGFSLRIEWRRRILIERIVRDTAYAYELRGARRQQAWENLKKMRGLIRRIQNRGYATLTRIADHIDALTPGDESNAVIEAIDAVNLMTVHAAKGLEFPIVFVVNLARGASAPPDPVRIVVDGEPDAPSVSIGPFVSETDEAERDREKQETRRLLYVAVTRARDRLYLSSPLKDGVLAPGRGSLAEVLPDSIKNLFNRASNDARPDMDGSVREALSVQELHSSALNRSRI